MDLEMERNHYSCTGERERQGFTRGAFLTELSGGTAGQLLPSFCSSPFYLVVRAQELLQDVGPALPKRMTPPKHLIHRPLISGAKATCFIYRSPCYSLRASRSINVVEWGGGHRLCSLECFLQKKECLSSHWRHSHMSATP
ncbi:UNVERIFIED_CONTAM: hypothetical protein K2H54_068749 [Gekko kuhli]